MLVQDSLPVHIWQPLRETPSTKESAENTINIVVSAIEVKDRILLAQCSCPKTTLRKQLHDKFMSHVPPRASPLLLARTGHLGLHSCHNPSSGKNNRARKHINQRTRKGGGKTAGGGPPENSARPSSPRYVSQPRPPMPCHVSYEVPYKLPEFPSGDPLKKQFWGSPRMVSKGPSLRGFVPPAVLPPLAQPR